MDTRSALDLIRLRKKRITPIRKAVVGIVFENDKPISAPEIKKRLKDYDLSANKTTVYRELKFLKQHGLVQKVNLSPFKLHYEPAHLDHHHHLVCKNCGEVDEVICKELDKPMSKLIKRVSEKFKIKEHNLEFYGYCFNCQ